MRFVALLVICCSAYLPRAMAAKPAPALLAPMLIGEENLGEVWTYPGQGEENFQLGTDTLLPALAQAIEEQAYNKLRAEAADRTQVTFAWLRERNVLVRFDNAALVLRLELRDELRRRKNLRIRRSLRDGDRETLGPAAFSGYFNGSVNQAFLYPKAQARQPFRGNLAGAANLVGFVLEGGETFTEKDQHEWTRDDTRLTRDFEGSLLRAQAGDIQLNTVGYQSARPLGGLSLSRQYSIQPYASIRPLNRTEVMLQRPSIIEVFVNDGFVTRMSAPAGPVRIEDFPLFSGLNQVRLKITDDTGRVEWVNLSMLYDVQLLGQGIQQFSYQAGAPSRRFRNDRIYDSKNTAFTGYHRYGLSDLVTAGANFQGDRNIVMGGGDFTVLTSAGLFTFEGAASDRGTSFDGQAGRIRYKSLDYKQGLDRALRLAIETEYKSPWFSGLAELFSYNEFSWKYDLHAAMPITATASIGAGFIFERNRAGRDDRRTWRSDLSSQIGERWRGSLAYSVTSERRVDHRIQLNLNWVAESGRYYGNVSYDYPSKTLRAEGTRNSSSVVDDYRATIGAQNSPENTRADALVEYTHEKANFRLEHASSYNRDTPGIRTTTHSTSVTAASALAWAGDAVGWTRPIYDSFALIRSRPALRGFEIPVNPVGDSFEAHINRAGPAVLPTLTSYNESPVVLDSSVLPPGYSLGREYFLARPTYRSGIALDVGADSTAIVTGRLLLPGGAPFNLGTGKAIAAAGAAQDFFTNREGVFVLEGLAPGKYELRPDKEGLAPFRFELPADKVGIVKLPPHTLERNQE
jgi:outer membrane usher protein